MSDLERSGPRTPRRQREQRAYRLVQVGGAAGLVGAVGLVLAIVGIIGWSIPILAAVLAVICALVFQRTVAKK